MDKKNNQIGRIEQNRNGVTLQVNQLHSPDLGAGAAVTIRVVPPIRDRRDRRRIALARQRLEAQVFESEAEALLAAQVFIGLVGKVTA